MNHLKRSLIGLAGGAAVLLSSAAQAEVKPHGLFSDNAVLQQGMRVPVWGTARDGEKVTVEFRNQKVTTEAVDGIWRVYLKPLKPGGPDTLTISGDNKVTIKNVLVGEVYVCSGQSNMEWPMRLTFNAESEIQQARDPKLRLLTIPRTVSHTPLHEVKSPWLECTPEAATNFSAVGYYFGRKLRQELDVPVGLINSSWGGTVAEAWAKPEALAVVPSLQPMLANYDRRRLQYPFARFQYEQALARHREAVEQARREGKMPPAAPPAPADPDKNPNQPSVLYNGMIEPLVPYAIRGAIWYQGESNAGRAFEYQTLFPTMIQSWRTAWGQGDFPFLFVQLAPFMKIQEAPTESNWAELREAQRLTMLNVPNTAMAVITDVGEEDDIHPRKKEPVGTRLALGALALANGKDITYSGPMFERLSIYGNKAIVHFDHVGGGLVAKGDKLTGFTIAGADKKWHLAEAKIQGNTVVVWSPEVKEPVAVRYGWWNYPVVNLWNKAGLPASPFRTDDFPLTTQPK